MGWVRMRRTTIRVMGKNPLVTKVVNITQTGGGSQSAGPRMGVPACPCFSSTHHGQDRKREAEAMQGLAIQRA